MTQKRIFKHYPLCRKCEKTCKQSGTNARPFECDRFKIRYASTEKYKEWRRKRHAAQRRALGLPVGHPSGDQHYTRGPRFQAEDQA